MVILPGALLAVLTPFPRVSLRSFAPLIRSLIPPVKKLNAVPNLSSICERIEFVSVISEPIMLFHAEAIVEFSTVVLIDSNPADISGCSVAHASLQRENVSLMELIEALTPSLSPLIALANKL